MPDIKTSVRPAWVEIDLAQLTRNFEIITRDLPAPVCTGGQAGKPANLKFISVIKDRAYGHGAVEVGRVALEFGATHLAAATIDEALELRQNGVAAPVMIFGERTDEELRLCLEYDFTCFINDVEMAERFARLSAEKKQRAAVHLEVDTGLSRYGVRWTKAIEVIEHISKLKSLKLEGVMSHFAMSDELDKSFALEQLQRFQLVLDDMGRRGIRVQYRHICNTGGYLDLPQAHFDLVRIGILPLGVYPSQVCRRVPGLQPIMSVKCKVAAIRDLEVGDYVGYGMRYRAESPRRIAVLPLGYGDGFPRVRNQGHVLIHGQRAPIIGGSAMDAMMVDVTDIPQTKLWDEVVLMGKQGDEEISVHEIAQLKGSVSYDILTGWSWRLPRKYRHE